MSRKPEERCSRGHRKQAPNIKPKVHGGWGCRSCECAVSTAANRLRRKGEQWTEKDIQRYADWKAEDLGVLT